MRRKRRELSDKGAAKLRAAGLRPTRQRAELAAILFVQGHRHVTAEQLYEEAVRTGARISLATVYNTLNQFTEAGLLRQVVIDAQGSYFDTNTGDHQHFFIEDEGRLIDIPGEAVAVSGIPAPPKGTGVRRVDVVVRVRRN